jgi:hypothetical protein
VCIEEREIVLKSLKEEGERERERERDSTVMLIRPQSLEILMAVAYEEALGTLRLFMLLRAVKPFCGLAGDLGASQQFFCTRTVVRSMAAVVKWPVLEPWPSSSSGIGSVRCPLSH